jgi:hypothetical protein
MKENLEKTRSVDALDLEGMFILGGIDDLEVIYNLLVGSDLKKISNPQTPAPKNIVTYYKGFLVEYSLSPGDMFAVGIIDDGGWL